MPLLPALSLLLGVMVGLSVLQIWLGETVRWFVRPGWRRMYALHEDFAPAIVPVPASQQPYGRQLPEGAADFLPAASDHASQGGIRGPAVAELVGHAMQLFVHTEGDRPHCLTHGAADAVHILPSIRFCAHQLSRLSPGNSSPALRYAAAQRMLSLLVGPNEVPGAALDCCQGGFAR